MAPLGACCKQGVIHEGESTGTIKEIGGIPTYVTLPTGDYDKTKAHLILPDVFGLELINARLVADSFALNGIPTYIPDLFNGDAVGADQMNDPNFDLFGKWFPNHGVETVRRPLDAVIAGLKREGITKFFGSGYCFGARYVVDLILEGTFAFGVVSHPSLLKVPEDLHALKAKGAPLLFNTCEVDTQFPISAQEQADEIFKGDANYKRTYWPKCVHGFAVRGDLSIPEVKVGKEGAFDASVEWIEEHL